MAASLHCNKCCSQFEPGGMSRAVSTSCGHLFCSSCLEGTFPALGKDGGSYIAQCPVCDESLMKSNIKVVPVLASASDIKMSLFGQSPETIMSTALAAINFYTVQQQVVSSFRETRLADKAIQMKEQCNKKLSEVHTAYQNAKRKYQSIVQEKAGLEQETKELQEKYRQKSKQNQELQRMYKELQMRMDNARRGGANGNVPMAMMGNTSPGFSNHSGGGGPQMVTTVHRTQVYGLGGLGGLGPDLMAGNDMLLGGKGMNHRHALHPASGALSPSLFNGGAQGRGVDASAQAMMQRREMLQQLPGGAGSQQPSKLLPGGAIGSSRRGLPSSMPGMGMM